MTDRALEMTNEELFLKYVGESSPTEYRHGEIEYYRAFLTQTDFVPNKIMEGLVSTLKNATLTNLLPSFLSWIRDTVEDYGDIVTARQYARNRINALQALEN